MLRFCLIHSLSAPLCFTRLEQTPLSFRSGLATQQLHTVAMLRKMPESERRCKLVDVCYVTSLMKDVSNVWLSSVYGFEHIEQHWMLPFSEEWFNTVFISVDLIMIFFYSSILFKAICTRDIKDRQPLQEEISQKIL